MDGWNLQGKVSYPVVGPASAAALKETAGHRATMVSPASRGRGKHGRSNAGHPVVSPLVGQTMATAIAREDPIGSGYHRSIASMGVSWTAVSPAPHEVSTSQ
jgi:hypothetical protein